MRVSSFGSSPDSLVHAISSWSHTHTHIQSSSFGLLLLLWHQWKYFKPKFSYTSSWYDIFLLFLIPTSWTCVFCVVCCVTNRRLWWSAKAKIFTGSAPPTPCGSCHRSIPSGGWPSTSSFIRSSPSSSFWPSSPIASSWSCRPTQSSNPPSKFINWFN